MEDLIRNFVPIDSIHGPFIINRHCALQAEALIKTGRPHIQQELDAMMQVVDQLPEGSVLVDGGANAGLVCIPLARRVLDRGGQVHAFEPQRTMYYALCGTVALNQLENLTVHNMGLSHQNGSMTVPPLDYSVDFDFGTTQLTHERLDGGREIPVIRLDALGLDRLDFFKLDIEGMECEALRGARQLIERHLPWCWVEYWKIGVQAIMAEFHGLDYAFHVMDGLNMLCVPNARWDRQRLYMNGEPLVPDGVAAAAFPDTTDLAGVRARALAHQANCEWGHALEQWRRLRGRGLDEVEISIGIAHCATFAGLPDAGLAALPAAPDRPVLTHGNQEQIHLLESMLLLRAGNNADAARARHACEQGETIPHFVQAGLLSEKQWSGQPLAGKRFLIMGYGGAGDMVQYARYLYAVQLAGCTQVVAVMSAALSAFLRHNFPDIDFIEAQGPGYVSSSLEYDYWCTFVTLACAFAFDPRPAAMPTGAASLECPPLQKQAWRHWAGAAHARPNTFLLGLNWQGMAKSDAEFFRSASLRDMAPLAGMSGTQAVCLNRDLAAPAGNHSTSMIFPGARIADFSDLAGLVAAMDAVVTTCTAQVHVAGALGIPAVLLLSPKADARWGSGSRTDLYSSVRIVRASRVNQWDGAVDQAMALISAMRMADSL